MTMPARRAWKFCAKRRAGQDTEKSVMYPGSIPPGYIENTLLAGQVYPGIWSEKYILVRLE